MTPEQRERFRRIKQVVGALLRAGVLDPARDGPQLAVVFLANRPPQRRAA